jgi:hypothetical protein
MQTQRKFKKIATVWYWWRRGYWQSYYFNDYIFYRGYLFRLPPYEYFSLKENYGLSLRDQCANYVRYFKRKGIKPVPIFLASFLYPFLLFFAFLIRKYDYLRYYLWNRIKCRTQSLYWRLRGEIECLKDEIIWRDIQVEYPAIKYKDDTAWGSDVILILDAPQYRKSDGSFAEPPSRVNTFLGFQSKPGKETKVRLRGKKNILTGEVRLIECLSHSGCWFDFYLANTGKQIFLK